MQIKTCKLNSQLLQNIFIDLEILESMIKLLCSTVFLLFLTVVLNLNFISIFAEDNPLKLSTDKNSYSIGETVNITLQNVGNNTITFSNAGIIGLKNADTGQCIWICPGDQFAEMLIDLEAGQTMTNNWDQKDRNGTQASPGNYTASVFNNASTTFTIVNGSDINSVNKINTDLSKRNDSNSSFNLNLTNIISETQKQIEKNFEKASEAIKLNDSLVAIQSIEQAKQEIDQLSICMTSGLENDSIIDKIK